MRFATIVENLLDEIGESLEALGSLKTSSKNVLVSTPNGGRGFAAMNATTVDHGGETHRAETHGAETHGAGIGNLVRPPQVFAAIWSPVSAGSFGFVHTRDEIYASSSGYAETAPLRSASTVASSHDARPRSPCSQDLRVHKISVFTRSPCSIVVFRFAHFSREARKFGERQQR